MLRSFGSYPWDVRGPYKGQLVSVLFEEGHFDSGSENEYKRIGLTRSWLAFVEAEVRNAWG